jgi:hypothetical protein
VTPLAWVGIGCGLAGAFLVAACIFAAVKKIAIGDALKVYFFGLASAILLTAGILAAIFLGRKKHDQDVTDIFPPPDSGASGIGATLDATRDRIHDRIKAIILSGGSD